MKATETTTVNFESHDAATLMNRWEDSLNSIERMVRNEKYTDQDGEHNKYIIQGDLNELLDKSEKRKFVELGIRKKKKLKNILNGYEKKVTVKSANKLLHFVQKHVLDLPAVVKIKAPKHDEIQKRRENWLKYRSLASQALFEYKLEKGNYYK